MNSARYWSFFAIAKTSNFNSVQGKNDDGIGSLSEGQLITVAGPYVMDLAGVNAPPPSSPSTVQEQVL
jgi:hypothetical protein